MTALCHALVFLVLILEINAVFQDACISSRILTEIEARYETNIGVGGRNFVSDDNLVPDWYSIAPGTHLSTSHLQLKIGSCGTYFPIWINGTHPRSTGMEVTALACRKTFQEHCYLAFSIKIINCGTHFVYFLKNTPVNSAYCVEFSGGCNSKTILPYSTKRGKSNFSKPGQQFVSDDAIIDGWYSVAAGTRLATNESELKIGSCGTLFPIWLNGTHPSITGETLTVTACMKTYFDVCHSPFPVQIINCGTHYTYNLKHTTANSAFCIETIEGTSEKTDVSTPLALYSTPTSMAIIKTDFSGALYSTPTSMAIIPTDFIGATLPHPGNDTYFGGDSARKLESILKTTTIVFSAVILCPMIVLLIAFLLKLKKRKMRLTKVSDQRKGMPVFFIPTSNGWMEADKLKVKSFIEPLVVIDLETEHYGRKNKEMY